MALGQALRDELLRQYGNGVLWVPIALAIGIGGYFALPAEPATPLLWSLLGLGVLCGVGAMRLPDLLRPMLWAVALVAFGLGCGPIMWPPRCCAEPSKVPLRVG